MPSEPMEGAIQFGLFGGHEVKDPITENPRWETLEEYYQYCAEMIAARGWDNEQTERVLSQFFRPASNSYKTIVERITDIKIESGRQPNNVV